jgi:hypothetical protein
MSGCKRMLFVYASEIEETKSQLDSEERRGNASLKTKICIYKIRETGSLNTGL